MSQEDNNKQASAVPKLCTGGCGFYGNQQWQGYCSSCFKKNTASSPALPPASSAVAPPSLSLSGPSAAAAAAAPAPAPSSISSSAAMAIDVPPSSSSSSSSSASALPAAPALAVASVAAGAGAASPALSAADTGTPATVASSVAGDGGGNENNGAAAAAKEVPRNRCFACKKKVGLTGFTCRCDKVFCGTHRYQDQHACTFDYRSHDRSILEKRNEKVVADKVEKI